MDITSDLEASIDDAMKNKTIIASIDAAFGFVICIPDAGIVGLGVDIERVGVNCSAVYRERYLLTVNGKAPLHVPAEVAVYL